MSPDDIDRLTIAEVRAISERASAALSTLRALGLAPMLGGAVTVTDSIPPNGHRPAPPQMDAAMAAQRAALLAANKAEALPDDIKKLEGIQ